MIAGLLHMLVGLTGIVGLFLRFIGPVTIIPALGITSLYIYKATTKFAKTQWGVAMLYDEVFLYVKGFGNAPMCGLLILSYSNKIDVFFVPIQILVFIRVYNGIDVTVIFFCSLCHLWRKTTAFPIPMKQTMTTL